LPKVYLKFLCSSSFKMNFLIITWLYAKIIDVN
jgi:hypothetical protein